jgi:protein subunit release factor B
MERKPFLTITTKDCDLQTFAAGGKGGQNQNTCNTGVR